MERLRLGACVDPNQLFERLNDQQKQAAAHTEGPLVVFAGAGSGKTRIITTRIAYLIDRGVPPWEILAVTFTNKAAAEMRQRLIDMCPEARRTTVTTFHSACARWLREFASELGFTGNFTIYDDGDTKAALKKIIKERHPKANIPQTLGQMRNFINFAKTHGYFPADIERIQQDNPKLVPPGGLELYRHYQEFLADCNAMDFGDLLLNIVLLLRRNQTVRSILSKRYQYILVDEFQDTNRTQFEIVETLSREHQNLFVVGDDDQSIYSWRGATPSNILEFGQTFPKARQIALEQNYRCSGNIVKAASHLIANNKSRAEKTLFTLADAGDPVEVHIESDGELEAWWVAKQIKSEKTRFSYQNTAIFYRTNSQSRALEEALRRDNIPYTIFGSVEFYDRMEVKDLIAYLKVIANENDEISLRRIINTPARGIGSKAIEQIADTARQRKISMIMCCRQLADEKIPRLGTKIRYFIDLYDALKKDLSEGALEDAMGTLLEATDYLEYLEKKYPDQYADKLDNIHELGSAMAEFSKQNEQATLEEWLQTITLVREDNEIEDHATVTLMTLHMAKGLEFPRVYIVGLEEGLIPHRNSLTESSDIEEERRLLYVGITRAKEKISLLAAQRRRTFQTINTNPASRFFNELPADVTSLSSSAKIILKEKHPEQVRSRHAQDHSTSDSDSSSITYDYEDEFIDQSQADLSPGVTVFHPTYGAGVIEGFDSRFGQNKVIVRFDEFGLRKIRGSQLSIHS